MAKAKKLGISPVVASITDSTVKLDASTRDDQDRDVYNICWNDDWIQDDVKFKQFKAGDNEQFLFHQRKYPSDEARQMDIEIFATDLDGKLCFLGYTRKTSNPAICRGAIATSVQVKTDPIVTLLDTVEEHYTPPQS